MEWETGFGGKLPALHTQQWDSVRPPLPVTVRLPLRRPSDVFGEALGWGLLEALRIHYLLNGVPADGGFLKRHVIRPMCS